jgi:hypothetical protein
VTEHTHRAGTAYAGGKAHRFPDHMPTYASQSRTHFIRNRPGPSPRAALPTHWPTRQMQTAMLAFLVLVLHANLTTNASILRVGDKGPCTEWLKMCGVSNASAPGCCAGSMCDVQSQCPSGARPPPGSRCGPTVDPSQCHFCQPPVPPPRPKGCGASGAACSTTAPCCENEGRCPSYLACINAVCRFMPPPSQPPATMRGLQ